MRVGLSLFMSGRSLGWLLIAIAVGGAMADAAVRGSGPSGVSPTTVADAYHFIATGELSGAASASPGAVSAKADFRNLASLGLLPLWFAMFGGGVFCLYASVTQAGAGAGLRFASRPIRRVAGLLAAVLFFLGFYIAVLDAASSALGGGVAFSTTLGMVLANSVPQAADSWFMRAIDAGGMVLDPVIFAGILRLPVWLVMALGGLCAAVLAIGPLHSVAVRPQPIDRTDEVSGKDERSQYRFASIQLGNAWVRGVIAAGVFSAIVNVLMLTGALFMLEVYDRILPSRSIPTLVAMGLIVLVLVAAQILLDIVRSRLLVRLGNVFHRAVAPKAFLASVRLPVLRKAGEKAGDPVHELDTIRSFMSSAGPVVLFDLPWLPIYLVVVFALHPLLGWTAAAGAVVLIVLTLTTDLASRRPTRRAAGASKIRNQRLGEARRNAEALVSMGMLKPLTDYWERSDTSYLAEQNRLSDITGGLGSLAKGLRLLLQSAVLAVGAYLVIVDQASAGVIIASAILANRALAPLDQAIGQWRNFVSARQSWQRLKHALDRFGDEQVPTVLPRPVRTLAAEQLSAFAPAGSELIVKNVSFTLASGEGLGLVGPSGSGKSTIAKLLVGAWRPVRGRIALDGANLDQWSPGERGRFVGYLPQTFELIEGSIAQNIARFDPAADAETIMAAAKAAGVHELITAMPQGYDTNVAERGEALSVGQRQRVALARALYGDPFLVVLDEPNSNLDSAGDIALTNAIRGVRERGGIVIVVAHRRSALAGIDKLLTLNQGEVVAFGEKDDVIAEFRRQFKNVPRHLQEEGETQPSRQLGGGA